MLCYVQTHTSGKPVSATFAFHCGVVMDGPSDSSGLGGFMWGATSTSTGCALEGETPCGEGGCVPSTDKSPLR